MRVCPNNLCPHRKLTGERASFDSDRERCSDCDAILVASDGAPTSAEPHPPAMSSRPVRPALVTLGVLAAIEAARHVPSPFVSSEYFLDDETFRALSNTSVLHSAIASAASAFAFVEGVALLIPALRRKRHDHPATRRTMTKVAWALTAFMTLSQGYAYTQYAGSLGMSESVDRPFIASFLLGPIALWVAVRVLDRWGIGGGWPTVLIGSIGAALAGNVVLCVRQQILAPSAIALLLALYAGWVALGWWFQRRRFERDAEVETADLSPAAYREPGVAVAKVRLKFRAPLWGTAPLAAGAVLTTAGPQLQALHLPGVVRLNEMLDASPWHRAGAQAAIALLMLAVFARLPTSLRQADARLAALGMRPGASSAKAIARAATATRAMMLGACALALLGGFSHLPYVDLMTGVSLLTATALGLDLADEWRAFSRHGALAPLLREQRVWLADATAALLEREGVPAFVRSANYHQLAWWGAPQAPAVVMVPADRLDEARAIIEPDDAPAREAPADDA